MARDYIYFERNVPYPLGVRMDINDSIGKLLTDDHPFVAVDVENIRDFKLANKKAIIQGLIKPSEEPNLDWETPNTITDAEINDLLKNYLKLKSKLVNVNSLPIVQKFYAAAKTQNKSEKIIALIKERLDEMEESAIDVTSMRGVE